MAVTVNPAVLGLISGGRVDMRRVGAGARRREWAPSEIPEVNLSNASGQRAIADQVSYAHERSEGMPCGNRCGLRSCNPPAPGGRK